MGGYIMNLSAGSIRDNTGSFESVFILAGLAYFTAILVIHLFAPRLEPANVEAA
jgi:ACS family hexuronate transporter-like MFS transporter